MVGFLGLVAAGLRPRFGFSGSGEAIKSKLLFVGLVAVVVVGWRGDVGAGAGCLVLAALVGFVVLGFGLVVVSGSGCSVGCVSVCFVRFVGFLIGMTTRDVDDEDEGEEEDEDEDEEEETRADEDDEEADDDDDEDDVVETGEITMLSILDCFSLLVCLLLGLGITPSLVLERFCCISAKHTSNIRIHTKQYACKHKHAHTRAHRHVTTQHKHIR